MSVGTSTAIMLAAGLGAAGSVAGSAISSGPKTVNTTTTLPPALQPYETGELSQLQGIANDPMGGLGPIQQSAQDSINTSYKNMPNTVTSMLASRGFGQSGPVGQGTYDVEGQRLSSLSSLYGQMAQLGSQRQLSASQIIQQMLAAGRSQSTAYPGNSTGAGLMTAGNQLGSLAGLMTLQQMLNGGGGSGTGGGGIVGNTGGILGTGQTPTAAIPSTSGSGSIFDGFSPDPTGGGWD